MKIQFIGVVDGRGRWSPNGLKQKKQKIPKLIKNTQTKAQKLNNNSFRNTRMKGFSYYPQFRLTCSRALVDNCLTENFFDFPWLLKGVAFHWEKYNR